MGRRSLAYDTAARLAAVFGFAPFTANQAMNAGVSADRARKALTAGSIHRLRRGVYQVPPQVAISQDATEWHALAQESLAAARAAILALPDSALSSTSAALLHGLPIPGRVAPAHVTHPGGRPGLREGVVIHCATLPAHHVMVRDDVHVTTPARTAIDIARTTDLPRSLITMDAVLRLLVDQLRDDSLTLRHAVHEPALTREVRRIVAATLRDVRGWPGTRNARESLALADPAAESALESRSRGELVIRGVPQPICGVPLVGADGRTYWADMTWEHGTVIGECDGLMKYADPEALYREKLRQEALEEAGHRIVRWTHADITRRPRHVANRVLNALAEARRWGGRRHGSDASHPSPSPFMLPTGDIGHFRAG